MSRPRGETEVNVFFREHQELSDYALRRDKWITGTHWKPPALLEKIHDVFRSGDVFSSDSSGPDRTVLRLRRLSSGMRSSPSSISSCIPTHSGKTTSLN